MKKAIAILAVALFANGASALTFAQVKRLIKTWDEGSDKVYHGLVTANGQYYQCLSVAFTKAENGVIHYYHKMWNISGTDCKYNEATQVVVANRGKCVKDALPGVRLIDKNSIDLNGSHARVINMNDEDVRPNGRDVVEARKVGQPDCNAGEGYSSLKPNEPTRNGNRLIFELTNGLAYSLILD